MWHVSNREPLTVSGFKKSYLFFVLETSFQCLYRHGEEIRNKETNQKESSDEVEKRKMRCCKWGVREMAQLGHTLEAKSIGPDDRLRIASYERYKVQDNISGWDNQVNDGVIK